MEEHILWCAEPQKMERDKNELLVRDEHLLSATVWDEVPKAAWHQGLFPAKLCSPGTAEREGDVQRLAG